MRGLAARLMEITQELSERVGRMRFGPPVEYVYNPLAYARAPHRDYVQKYARPGVALWVGMNPGPFGMAQTGVPFGDVAMVRDFLGVSGALDALPRQHPKRPIRGFDCGRSEVSGTRLWGYARDRFGAPRPFFEKFFVVNYCPLVFMADSGKNITPDKLPAAEAERLTAACDEALRRLALAMDARFLVGVGAFARRASERALCGTGIPVGQILHPSPASPLANRGWAEAAHRQLQNLQLV
jgi:single-strand selective monofunctional uracil DNA glycosylase